MANNYTQGSTRVALQQPDLTTFQANGSVVLDSRRTRPVWFDGRFLAARDLDREQNYFLQREADLGQAPGFAALDGLLVERGANPQTVIVRAGTGVTPAGELVTVATDLTIPIASLTEDQSLDAHLGLASSKPQPPGRRTGIYVIGLRPFEYTANPVSEYPTTVLGPRTTHDGDIVEATAVTLTPYPTPATSSAASLQQSALARQIFLTGNPAALPDSLLPLALVGLQQGSISWLDPYLVRRDAAAGFSGVRFGLTDPAGQQAYLVQYDLQLQAAVAARQNAGLKANFAASDVFQSIPPAGRFPLDGIDTSAFSQVFFPQQMDVRLSIIPQDDLAALLDDSLSLPPIDLTLPQSAYSNLSVFAFVPVPLASFAALKSSLPILPLNPTLPQVLANRRPIELLRLYQGNVTFNFPNAVQNNAWATAVSNQTYGFYLRRASDGTFATFETPLNLVLSAAPDPSIEGQAVTFTVNVIPANATGNMKFMDGPNTLGSAALAGGVATFLTSSLAVGAHSIVAVYGGDAENSPNTSNIVIQTVTKAPSNTVLSSSANPSNVGQTVTLTAAVTPNTATGSVRFLEGANVLNTQTVSGGQAVFNTSALPLGDHTLTASYAGDNNFAGSASTPLDQKVIKAPSTTLLASLANPATVTHSVPFTATVTPASATGNVQFLEGAAVLGTGSLTGGVASFSTSTLAVGAHSITAKYLGDAATAASLSNPVAQAVIDIVSSVVVNSSANPAAFGVPVTFSATLTPNTATGTVKFLDGGNSLGSATLNGGVATLPSNSTLAVGTHNITAEYSGDTNNAPSTSAVMAQNISKVASSVVVLSSPNPSTVGDPVTFSAGVSPTTAGGTVNFFDGTTPLGPATVSGGAAKLPALSTLAAGAHTITGVYTGDNNTAAATSQPLTQTVNKQPSTVALTATPPAITVGQTVTFAIKVTPASATGTINLVEGTATTATGALASAQLSFAIATLPVGAHTLTAAYLGDANTLAGNSASVQVTVNKAAAGVTVKAAPNPSAFGQTVTFTAVVTPGSATGAVTFLADGAALGSAQLSGATATFANAGLAVGTHAITAVYGGDNNNSNATSPTVPQTVNKAATVTRVSAPAASGLINIAVTFTALVVPAAASGTVDFLDNGKVIGSGVLKGGQAVFETATLPVGANSITASYQGDADFDLSVSAPFPYNVVSLVLGVLPAATTTPAPALTPAPAPAKG